MAKLSDIFSRKPESGTDKIIPLPAMPLRGNGPSEPGASETPVDAGARIGEENEVLRNLLTDAGRKIGELDELKQAFDRLVLPFNATLRALETEKSQTLSLAGRLEEQRAAYDKLCGEFYQIERKATQLDSEAARLRSDLELARESARALESTRSETAEQLKALEAHFAEVERQLERETAERRAASEARRTIQEHLDAAGKRIVDLEGELAAARERLVLTEDEKTSLQHQVEQALAENARLTRRLTDNENTVTAIRAQLAKVEASHAEAHSERGRLAAALDEAKEQHQSERNTLTMRLEGLTSRAATAERLLAEARTNLMARTEEVRGFDRKAVEANIARGAAERRLQQLESAHEARERQIRELETARNTLADRNNELAKSLKTREMALARAEESVAALTARNGQLEADIQVSRVGIERRVEDLSSALERERLERAVVEGALEAARKDNARLQHELSVLRANARRGIAADEAPTAPAEHDEAAESSEVTATEQSVASAGGQKA
jgi:chromosome segregation ATPase